MRKILLCMISFLQFFKSLVAFSFIFNSIEMNALVLITSATSSNGIVPGTENDSFVVQLSSSHFYIQLWYEEFCRNRLYF